MRILTDFADQAVLLPLILAVGTILLALGWGRAARAWAFAVPGTLVAMLVLKIIFLACAPLWPDLPLRSPSGHVAAAAAVYGSIAWLLGLRPSWLMAAAAAAVIGASRLALGVHNPAEVALGAVVGVLGTLAFTALASPMPRQPLRWPLLAATGLVWAGFHGQQLGAEAGIAAFAADYIRPLLSHYADEALGTAGASGGLVPHGVAGKGQVNVQTP